MTVLATTADSPKLREAGRHEPLLMAIGYGEGGIFHTTLGHDSESLEGMGFITTFQRGAEWAATGKVTQDFLGKDAPSKREFSVRP
jgi:type 1 glutamine amidotransferase